MPTQFKFITCNNWNKIYTFSPLAISVDDCVVIHLLSINWSIQNERIEIDLFFNSTDLDEAIVNV